MQRTIGCNVVDHAVSRRGFLAGSMAGTIGLGNLMQPAQAEQLQRDQKRILQIFLAGGASQLETWDPKPGTVHGGPFRAIPTSVPGIHISELLPHTAQRMHLLSLVRSLNIKTNDHGQGRLFMEKGRRAGEFPFIGSVAARYLAPQDSPLPGNIHISTRGSGQNTSAFLGAGCSELYLEGGKSPADLVRPDKLTADADLRRNELRRKLNERFSGRGGQPAFTEAYNTSYDMADKLMARKSLFEADPSAGDLARYGKHDFARNCILARTLLESGGTCVKVSHREYDTHAENFNFHLEQMAEFDRTFSTLIDDLKERGMLESTLVMVFSEFGRTPKVNQRYGRDHWGTAWSVALGGCGLVAGAVVGKTNDTGTAVIDREVDGGHLFHTYFQALGLDTGKSHDLPGRIVPIGDPSTAPIKELLA